MVAFTAGSVLTAANLNTAFNALTVRAVTATTDTLLLADNGGAVSYSNASPVAVTVPLFSSVAYATGTKIVLVNLGAGTVTVAGAVGVTINGTPLTLAQYAGGSLVKTDTNTWLFLPFSSGSARATVTSTTGSPTITTVGTKTCYVFTGSGSVTVGTAGLCEVLVVGGGGNGGVNGGGGGAGGYCANSSVYISGTLTVTVGAGAPATSGSMGQSSQIGDVIIGVGGAAGTRQATATYGGSGGGASSDASSTPGTAVSGQGSIGGARNSNAGGGGGGASAAGAAATSGGGGAGGAGTASSITGTSVTRAGGGGGAGLNTAGAGGAGGGGAGGTSNNGTAGTANTGGGGGAGWSSTGAAGGSGVVILLIG